MQSYTTDQLLALLNKIDIDDNDRNNIDDDEQQAYVDGYHDAIEQLKTQLNP